MKALLVTTVSGFVPQFEMNNVHILQHLGYEVHYASNFNTPSYGTDNHRLINTGIICHQIDFVRSPFNFRNFRVYQQLCDLMEQEQFSLVHCHTPMGGVMARLSAYKTQTKPVVYTAHGFHFYTGAPWVNWLFYYPIEKLLSRFTDQQICINQEDFQRAKKTFHAKYIDYIPGVGLDFTRIPSLTNQEVEAIRTKFGLSADKLIIMSTGELIKRKNHETVIRAIAVLKKKCPGNETFPNIHYVLCGHGTLKNHLADLAKKLDVSEFITFLGYREDVLNLYQAADIFIFPSLQEGLPVALLEAMASRLPVICSDIRGNHDLMGNPIDVIGKLELCSGGIMIKNASDSQAFAEAIRHLTAAPEKLSSIGHTNAVQAEHFSIKQVSQKMNKLYERLLNSSSHTRIFPENKE